jgi:hypothetical protein
VHSCLPTPPAPVRRHCLESIENKTNMVAWRRISQSQRALSFRNSTRSIYMTGRFDSSSSSLSYAMNSRRPQGALTTKYFVDS